MRARRAALLAAAWLVAAHGATAAQTTFSAGIGETADAASGATTGRTVFLGVARTGTAAGVGIGAGLPLDASLGSKWASAAGWLDAPALFDNVGLLGDAQAFVYADPVLDASGGAASGQIEAYLPVHAGPARIRLRAGGRAGALSTSGLSVRRALAAAGADGTVLAGDVVVRGGVDLWAGAGSLYPRASLQGLATFGPVALHGRLARWLHDDLPDTGWGISARIALTDRLALLATAARPEPDVLFFSPVQRSWSVGLRYGNAPALPRALPAPVIAEAGQTVQVRVRAPDRGPVRIAGTFNEWRPRAMRPDGDAWVAELSLPPGVYEYAFVAEDGTWFVPEETPGRKPDGFGGFVATLVVR